MIEVFMILYSLICVVGFIFQLSAFMIALYLWRKRGGVLWRYVIVALCVLSFVPDVLLGLFLWEALYVWRCLKRKQYKNIIVAILCFCAAVPLISLLMLAVGTRFEAADQNGHLISREELTNAAISPMQHTFYAACRTFQSATNNTERFASAEIFVPVLQEYVVRKPDEKYKSDLSFTNIVYLLGQGTSMTTNKLVYDVSTAENPDTRVEFMADPPPVVNSVQIISGRSK